MSLPEHWTHGPASQVKVLPLYRSSTVSLAPQAVGTRRTRPQTPRDTRLAGRVAHHGRRYPRHHRSILASIIMIHGMGHNETRSQCLEAEANKSRFLRFCVQKAVITHTVTLQLRPSPALSKSCNYSHRNTSTASLALGRSFNLISF
ncbi:hypothetical protein RRG08_049396 [Elysia crispata]|uniref:Uncharacterized protein n=1 Tax=Elysia crispata TaxID=231223 RepID=A0AAE0XDZ1_9GAST|nr:hypothetical protein RRG08_049396 [Elysia crispata]